jgi:dienelactone hydrolase
MKTQDITYQDGLVNLSGFIAWDDTKSGPRPGVLVMHEAWGLGEHVMLRARQLAEMGYVAFAADLYGERKQVAKMEDAMALIGDLRAQPQKLRLRARAALTACQALPQVYGRRVGAIGFCFGGTTVLELARDGADVAAVVSFHGGLETQAPAEKGQVKAKILVLTGADDPMVPANQVVAFEDEMKKAGADARVISYPAAVHGFMNPDADGSIAPGILYNEAVAVQAWAEMGRFLKGAFGA